MKNHAKELCQNKQAIDFYEEKYLFSPLFLFLSCLSHKLYSAYTLTLPWSQVCSKCLCSRDKSHHLNLSGVATKIWKQCPMSQKKKTLRELWRPSISFPFNNNPALQERVPNCHFINNWVSKTFSKVFPCFHSTLWPPLRIKGPQRETKESRQCIAYQHNLIQTVHGMGYCTEHHISKYVKSKPISILHYFLECVCLHLY